MNLLKYIVRNTFRHKLRTSLTVLGMAIVVLAYCLLRTVVAAWYAGVEASSPNRLITRNAVSLIFPLPISYLSRIKEVPGVVAISYGRWFGGIYINEKNFFPQFAVDAEHYLDLYPEFLVPEKQLEAFKKDRRGCIAGRLIARKYGWKIGDTITIRGTIFPGTWDFILRGIYRGRDKGTDESQFFFHWDYLNESLKKTMPLRADHVGWFVVKIADTSRAAQISRKIDSLFENSLAETLTETEKAFQMGFVSMTEAIVVAIKVISYVVIGIILVVLSNTMAMTARERTREYGVLKTLGFEGPFLFKLIIGESLTIAVTGGILGIILSFPAARIFAKSLETFFPIFNLSLKTLASGLLAATIVGILSGIFPGVKASKTSIVESLSHLG
ncbi:MAG TPA: FtsX-like permease family protein [Deltaproteobacteria bacterium]|nr:FtsX-like permease family protein [Deltaproteobacteria bacterium]